MLRQLPSSPTPAAHPAGRDPGRAQQPDDLVGVGAVDGGQHLGDWLEFAVADHPAAGHTGDGEPAAVNAGVVSAGGSNADDRGAGAEAFGDQGAHRYVGGISGQQ
ncbi:hypothetical protein L3Q67_26665 [Saccharothrix sp. AJ9571]|nr:hypothetical protein L3Q67_26665 [Saccharothrix sp. AJ9571]